MSSIYYPIIRPATYSLSLRAGVQNIRIEFRWDGGGSVRLEIISPTKNYTEDQMKITDKTTIRADGIVICRYLRRYELTVPKLPREEVWTIRLTLEGVYKYSMDVEAS
ncbi:MAG: hypothetical protein QW390_00160 [Candidatus Bathyarchaeia archaeon]